MKESRQAELIKRRVFSVLWEKSKEGSIALDLSEVQEWLECEAWPLLFPGHCFRCHGFEDGPCEAPEGHGAFACPACAGFQEE